MTSPTRLASLVAALALFACGGSSGRSPTLLKVPVDDAPQRGPSDA